ncbi:MAG: beta-lactamase family protein [Clostridiales bacterium]|nr:beta-lactamase family protein [Clostridiales bacterium]
MLATAAIICAVFPSASAYASQVDVNAFLRENGSYLSGAAVMRLEDGAVSQEWYYGSADIENGKPIDRDTIFEWGSATEMLVWISAMQLAEDGALKLDEDIRPLLPEGFLKKLKYGDPITVLNLMNHNAGWGDATKDIYTLWPEKTLNLESSLIKMEPLQIYPPGRVCAYSTYGAAIAGFIVERISSVPFYEYAAENIFKKLGMLETTVHPTQGDRPDLAARRSLVKAYTGFRAYMANNRVYTSMYPAGSAMGSALDAAKFLCALTPPEGEASPLFKSKETLDKLLAPSLYYPDGAVKNAHGFWAEQRNALFLSHGGDAAGFSSCFWFSPETRESLLMLSNTAGKSMLANRLADIILGPEIIGSEAKGEGTAEEISGVYFSARQDADTYQGIIYKLSPVILTAQSEDSALSWLGSNYIQQAPYIFKAEDEYSALPLLRFVLEDGAVTGISSPYEDYIKTPMLLPLAEYFLLLAYAFTIPAIIICLAASGLRKAIRKPAKSPMRVIRNSANFICLLLIMNTAILLIRGLSLESYSSLAPHFIINACSIPIFAAYLIACRLVRAMSDVKKSELFLTITAGLHMVVIIAAVAAFQLWK